MPSSSRLGRLTLRVKDDPRNQPLGLDVERDMFVLEELAMAGLEPLRDVRVEGVPQWFAECLVLSLMGKGGEAVRKMAWDEDSEERRRDWQPMLDWREYAGRNGVVVPAEGERFFTPVMG